MHLIGRGENDSKNSYPVVDSNVKAAHTKPMVFYLSELATEISMLRPSNSFDFWKCFLHHPSISHTGRCKVFVFFQFHMWHFKAMNATYVPKPYGGWRIFCGRPIDPSCIWNKIYNYELSRLDKLVWIHIRIYVSSTSPTKGWTTNCVPNGYTTKFGVFFGHIYMRLFVLSCYTSGNIIYVFVSISICFHRPYCKFNICIYLTQPYTGMSKFVLGMLFCGTPF